MATRYKILHESGALGTPSSGTGTNITGIPAANILAGSFGAGAYVISTSLQAATIELGHATDTTIARVSAGVVSIEGVNVIIGSVGTTDNALVRANGTGGVTLQASSSTATLSDNNDLTLYDATNDGNPVLAFGASATERLTITPAYDAGAQTLDFIEFATAVASVTADKGEYRFNVDGSLIATIDDGGIELADAKAYFIDTSNVLTEVALGASVLASSLTSVGTLAALTMGGNINLDGNNIDNGGVIFLIE